VGGEGSDGRGDGVGGGWRGVGAETAAAERVRGAARLGGEREVAGEGSGSGCGMEEAAEERGHRGGEGI
jgi:hypothetical protein